MQNKAGILLLFFLVFTSVSLHAQYNDNLFINSGDLIRQGAKLHEEGKYGEAIRLYKQIPRSDTNYADALYELGYSCSADSQYTSAVNYTLEGMRLFPHLKQKYTLVAANALDNTGKSADAIALYNSAVAGNPNAAILYFNRGITYYNLKDKEAARNDFEKCLLTDPYYSSAHYFRGVLYLEEAKLVPAVLAFKTYLLVAPDGKYKNKVITLLSSIARVTDEITGILSKNQQAGRDNFSPVQEILLSKIALDKQYQLKAALEDVIVRQLQVIDEQLRYIAADKSFAMQYYVPLYEKIFSENNFEPMIFTIFSGLELEKVTAWNKSNKKKSDNFITSAVEYLSLIRSTREPDKNKRTASTTYYLFEEGEFTGKGILTDKSKSLYTGSWNFYHLNGQVKARGRFNEAEEKQGEWQYFYETGKIKEKTNYINGKVNGLSEAWYENGNRWLVQHYADDELEGSQASYYYNGNMHILNNYKKGKKEGSQKEYNSKGYVYYTTSYSDDKENGQVITYFEGGQVKEEFAYQNDKKEGTYKSYFENGKTDTEGKFAADKKQGLWKSYYAGGAVKENTTYKNDEITGEFTMYYENGNLSRKGNYTRKKVDGKVEDFDDDGKLYSSALYDNGKLKEIVFYNKAGQVISSTTTRKGAANITFYTPEGIKESEGNYDKDGQRNGVFTEYFASGKVLSKAGYKQGLAEGVSTEYYFTGQTKAESNYTGDTENGESKGYHFSGKLKYHAWVINGELQQHRVFYNGMGDVTSREYYLDGELSGYLDFFNPGGKRSFEYRYKDGWVEEFNQFDSTGKLMCANKFEEGSGPVITKYNNGSILGQGTYNKYMLTGPYKFFYPDGSVSTSMFYKYNEADSFFKSYYPGGKIKAEGRYINGKKEGVWKTWFENGQLAEEESFVNGNLDGEDRVYKPDGKYDRIVNYKAGSIDGEYKIWGDSSKLAVILLYKRGIIKAYTYQGRDGKLIPPVKIEAQSGLLTAYYKNGTISAEFTFTDNEMQGIRNLYYSSGKPYLTGFKQFGFDDGLKKTYYPDGKIWKEENFILGARHGSRKTYYPGGKTESEEWYYDDEEHGIFRYFDEGGKLKQTRTYYYGDLQNIQ